MFVIDSMAGLMLTSSQGLLGSIYSLGVFIPSLAVLARRLHDVGKSGWFSLIILIPIIGFIWLLILLATDSEPGTNQYGPNPINPESDIIDHLID